MKNNHRNINDRYQMRNRKFIIPHANKLSVKAIFTIVTLVFATLSVGSCKKFVEIPAPVTELVAPSVFANNSTATSAITVIYNQMNSNEDSFNISEEGGLSADELTNHSIIILNEQFYQNALSAQQTLNEWQNGYHYIYEANAVIAGLQQNIGVSAAAKEQLTGEAYFIRAFWHLYLTDLFGAIPVATTTDYTVTDKLARSPRQQVLQQVISDLVTAQGMLNTNYVDISDSLTTTERVRPTKSAAAALLARAYLYLGDYTNQNQGDYQNAVKWASTVISNSTYSLSPLSGTNSVFKKNSSEAIWQLQTNLPTSNYATPDGQSYILTAAPSTEGIGTNTLSSQLLGAFEAGDARQANWVGVFNSGGNTWYFPYKYKDYNVSSASEYTMVLRLGEQYLLRAEAEAEQGQTAQAVSDLNIIRNRAGLANYAGLTDKASLLTAILHERQIELFSEWGHRWIDLSRAIYTASTVNANTVLGSPGNVCTAKGGIWSTDDHQLLFPISQTDMQLDPKLSQNPGY